MTVFRTSESFCECQFKHGKQNTFCINPKCFYSTKVPCSKVTNTVSKGSRLLPSRYICATLGFLTCVIITSQRLNLTMALGAMVNQTKANVLLNTVKNDTLGCPSHAKRNSINEISFSSDKSGVFPWDTQTQHRIVSASFLGFVITQIPGGRLSETIGAKQILVISLIIASVCNILSPLAASLGAYMLLTIQFIKGLAQGMTQPALTCLIARWFPHPERGFLSSVTFSGYPGGAVIGGLVSGVLCDMDVLGGWPLVFYIFGFAGLLLSVLMFFFTFNNPEDDLKIKESELKYIISNIDILLTEKRKKTPWKLMFTSVRTWALFFGMFGQYWMVFYFLSGHLSYLSTMLHFSNTENGYLNSTAYLGQILISWLASYFSDLFINKGLATINSVRKICNTLSCIGFSLSLIGAVFAGCNKKGNVICFLISICCVGFGYPGANIVAMDMTTNFAGTLMGIASTFASTTGFIIPLVVGSLTTERPTLDEWSVVFYISAAIGISSGIIFILFGSAETQKWDT